MENKLIIFPLKKEGKLVKTDVKTLICGVGKVNSAIEVTKYLTEHQEINDILLIGACGAIGDEFNVGDACRINAVYQLDIEPIEGMSHQSAIGGSGKVIYTGDKFITGGYKYGLFDMETFAVSEVCNRLNRKLTVIRVVSDKCDENMYNNNEDLVAKIIKKEVEKWVKN